MQFFRQNKATIGAIAAFGLIIYVYFAYFRGSSEAPLTATDAAADSSSALLVTLANLHTLKLDNGIFSDPVFLSLTDFGVQIDPQNVGRRNPFAPLGN